MLTIQDINDVSFRKANFSGYNSDDVDQFIDEVLETVTALNREVDKARAQQAPKSDNGEVAALKAKNAELQQKISILAERIEQYRAEEDAIKDAILSAQRLGSASIREAKAKADATISEANAKAEAILAEARSKSQVLVDSYQMQIAEKQHELDVVKRKVSDFRSKLYDMYRQHLAEIEQIPQYNASETPVIQPPARPTPVAAPAVNTAVPVTPVPVEEDDEEEEVIPIPAAALHEEVEEAPEPEYEEEEETPETEEEPAEPVSEKDAYIQEQFSGIGLDLNAYSDVPEALQKEKESKFSSFDYGMENESKKGKFKRR